MHTSAVRSGDVAVYIVDKYRDVSGINYSCLSLASRPPWYFYILRCSITSCVYQQRRRFADISYYKTGGSSHRVNPTSHIYRLHIRCNLGVYFNMSEGRQQAVL